METLGVIFILAAVVGGIFLMRMIGAWMLRIDEVVDELKGLRADMKKYNNPIEQKAEKYDALEEAKKAAHNKI